MGLGDGLKNGSSNEFKHFQFLLGELATIQELRGQEKKEYPIKQSFLKNVSIA